MYQMRAASYHYHLGPLLKRHPLAYLVREEGMNATSQPKLTSRQVSIKDVYVKG
jgi:hypothetical protein